MNVDDITLGMIDALNAANIPYMLVGSFSSNYYGIPRSTQDADFVIELGNQPIGILRRFLSAEYRVDPQMSFEGITGTYRNVVKIRGSEFKIELFRVSQDPHDRTRFDNRITITIHGRTCFVPRAEDVIITKLKWCRPKDRDDVRDVIAVQDDNLDWDYINSWCDRHGTRELLDEIRRSIPPL